MYGCVLPPGTSLGTFLVLRHAWRASGRPHSLGPEVIQGTLSHSPATALDVSGVGNRDFSPEGASCLSRQESEESTGVSLPKGSVVG